MCGVLSAACSKAPSGESAPAIVAAPAPVSAIAEPLPAKPASGEPIAPEPAPASEQLVDAGALERRFLAAQNDPAERIAVVQELADVPPATALSFMNRLYPIERREDVKMEMLSALGDLDHEKDRDAQLALCMKAHAPGQPSRVRYVAVQVVAGLGDPRGIAMLTPLTRDSDRDVRAAAVQVLRDLRED